jgi:dipeptidyl aminopeptidase/acylaminoacyl peptidase
MRRYTPLIMLHPTAPPFDYRELDKESRLWVPNTDPKRLEEIARQISPVYHVSPDDPPTLIIHGDQDRLVPLQQSELIVEKLEKAGVDTKLVVKKGAGHGWLGLDKDETQLVDWFDKYLKKAS